MKAISQSDHIHHNDLYFLPTEAVLTDSMGSICPIADVPVTAMKGDRQGGRRKCTIGMRSKGRRRRIKPGQSNTGGIGSTEQ